MIGLYSFSEYEKTEKEIESETLKEFTAEIELFRKGFNLACEMVFSFFEYHSDPMNPVPTVHMPLVLMTPRLVCTMKSMYNLMSNGYYYDATVLYRTFLENLGLCIYLSKNEDSSIRWGEGRTPEMPYIRLLDQIDSLIAGGELESEGHALYGKLSRYIHGDIKAVVHHFYVPNGSKDYAKAREGTAQVTIQWLVYDREEFKRWEVLLSPMLLCMVLLKLGGDKIYDKGKQEKVMELASRFLVKFPLDE